MLQKILVVFVGGLTGAGLGTVFGASLVLYLGKGSFSGFQQHTDVMLWTMVAFGLVFMAILTAALGKKKETD